MSPIVGEASSPRDQDKVQVYQRADGFWGWRYLYLGTENIGGDGGQRYNSRDTAVSLAMYLFPEVEIV